MTSSAPPGNGDDARRGAPRIAAKFRVRFKSMDELVLTYTQDISRGGLFIASNQFLPIGSIVQLHVELDDGRPPAKVTARVAYALDEAAAQESGRPVGMGMEFMDAVGDVASRIAALLTGSIGGGDDDAAPVARIVVVDDSPNYRNQAVAALRAEGHDVRAAENGLQAVGMVMRDPPDLVLSDVQMPVMDGWQFLRLVRARPTLARVPVVFFTTLSGEEERLKGYRLGVDDYITKPFSSEELVARVSRVLDRAQRRPNNSADRGALSGDLAQVSLPSVLAFVEAERRTGHLLVVSEGRIATMHMQEGNIVHVHLSGGKDEVPEGAERVFHVLDWTAGRFEFGPGEVEPSEAPWPPTSYLIMEHARRTDEAKAGD